MSEYHSIPWPLAIIDFEASSLENDSYPIEVGIAVWRGADQSIDTWSKLIRPTREWCIHGRWSRKSQKMHRIRGNDLVKAPGADVVAAELCCRLDGIRTVWSDGGPYDTYWNTKLFAAAGSVCPFHLGDWHRMLVTLPAAIREAVLSAMEASEQKHRAAADASALMKALAGAWRDAAAPTATKGW